MPSESAPEVEVVRFADPWCWWTWCMEPVVRRLEEVYGDGIVVTNRMAGMFEDLRAWMQSEDEDETSTQAAIQEAAKTTGMPIRTDYLWRSGVRTSEPACLAYKAAELQGRELANRFFRRMMEAFMVEGRHASHELYLQLADEVGLQSGRLRLDVDRPIVKESTERDAADMHHLGAEYDCLLLKDRSGRIGRVDGFAPKPYEDAIDVLAPDLPKRRPADLIEYAQRRRSLVPPREVAEVFGITEAAARGRLYALATAGLLDPLPPEYGPLWQWRGPEPNPLPIKVLRVAYVARAVDPAVPPDIALTSTVRTRYEEVAARPRGPYPFPVGAEAAATLGYPAVDLREVPPAALECFTGVGYAFEPDGIERKDTVLDVGCGSGTDLFLAARKATRGVVYGLDVSSAMVARARASIAESDRSQVKALERDAAAIPLGDASVDVAMGNGTLRLVADRAMALREIARVLRPGGHLQIADVAAGQDVRGVLGPDPGLWADGIGGVPAEASLLQAIASAGFQDVRVSKREDYFAKSSSSTLRRIARAVGARSIVVHAVRSPLR